MGRPNGLAKLALAFGLAGAGVLFLPNGKTVQSKSFLQGIPAEVRAKPQRVEREFSANLDLDELLGVHREQISRLDTSILTNGSFNAYGRVNYSERLAFQTFTGDKFCSSLKFVHEENEDDLVDNFLHARDTVGTWMFQYDLEFEGLELPIGEGGILKGLPTDTFRMLNTDMMITNGRVKHGTIDLLFFESLMRKNLTGTENVVVGGKEYEISRLESNPGTARFSVNGQLTRPLEAGEFYTLKDGKHIAILGVYGNEVDIAMGDAAIRIRIPYNGRSQIESNHENIEDALVSLDVERKNGVLDIRKLSYRLQADTLLGDLYIPLGGSMREELQEPEAMLTPNWDITYSGTHGGKHVVTVGPAERKTSFEIYTERRAHMMRLAEEKRRALKGRPQLF